ncbi:MAG: hypothetical protein QW674_07725 [Candidatus Bathyarchaeia archaeon]
MRIALVDTLSLLEEYPYSLLSYLLYCELHFFNYPCRVVNTDPAYK